jgi:hypothetical protein
MMKYLIKLRAVKTYREWRFSSTAAILPQQKEPMISIGWEAVWTSPSGHSGEEKNLYRNQTLIIIHLVAKSLH